MSVKNICCIDTLFNLDLPVDVDVLDDGVVLHLHVLLDVHLDLVFVLVLFLGHHCLHSGLRLGGFLSSFLCRGLFRSFPLVLVLLSRILFFFFPLRNVFFLLQVVAELSELSLVQHVAELGVTEPLNSRLIVVVSPVITSWLVPLAVALSAGRAGWVVVLAGLHL